MLIIKHTAQTQAPLEAVWNIWQDVQNWNTWDIATESSSLNGPFKEGTKGSWTDKSGRVVPITLVQVEPLKMSVVEFKLLLARMVVTHHFSYISGKTQVTEQIEIKGPLAFLFAYLVSSKIKENLPQQMEALVKKAESLGKTEKPS